MYPKLSAALNLDTIQAAIAAIAPTMRRLDYPNPYALTLKVEFACKPQGRFSLPVCLGLVREDSGELWSAGVRLAT